MTRWVLVVEDEAPLGEMICDNLNSEGYGSELIGNGKDAIERIARGGIDLVVLDIMLPGADGFEVLEQMRKHGDKTPVLILSARSSDDDRIRGLELSADDYLTKPFNLRELLLRVGALLRRAAPVAAGEDTLSFAGNSVDFRTQQARTYDGREETLTVSETRLLRLLASRPDTVVTRREIVEHLFGPTTAPTARTVDTLVLKLRKLFERDGRNPAHIKTVRGLGWRFVPAGETD